MLRSSSAPYAPVVLTDHVRQQSEKTRAFDGARQLPLLFGGNRGDPTRHNLAALGHISLQELHVFVIDLRRIGAGKWTGLTPTKEGPAGRCWGRRHGGHFSLVMPGVASSLEPSRAVRPSRSRRYSPRSRSRKLPRSRSRNPKPRSSRSRSRSTLRIIAEGPSSCSRTRTVR